MNTELILDNVNQQRKLATIQKVNSLLPIEGADKIERAIVQGWQSVVKKGEYKEGDWVVFCEVDSILPKTSWSEFLIDKNNPEKPIRLKTIRLRGAISQGLVLPISILSNYSEGMNHSLENLEIGMDLTQVLGITKYEPPVKNASLAGNIKRNFPPFLRKTDTQRLQSNMGVLEEFRGKEIVVCSKLDGTSLSAYFYNGEFGVCSRNLELKKPEEGDVVPVYWEIAFKYDLENKLSQLGKNICIQGEICGVGVQGNKMGLSDRQLFVFDVWDIDNQKYLGYWEQQEVVKQLGLQSVKLLLIGNLDSMLDLDVLLEYANNLRYDNGGLAEGIVIRPIEEYFSKTLRDRLAIKVISNEFLLKNGE